MKLTDFAKPMKAANAYVKVGLGGFAGGGKSYTGTLMAIGVYKQTGCKAPVLMIDNEGGSRFLQPLYKAAGIETYLKDTVSLSDVKAAIDLLEKGEISLLFIDSLTKVYANFVNEYKAKNRVSFMQMLDWAKVIPAVGIPTINRTTKQTNAGAL